MIRIWNQIRIHTNNDGPGSGRPKNLWILRIRIHNTAFKHPLPPSLDSPSLHTVMLTGKLFYSLSSDIHRKKGLPHSRPQPGCHLPNPSLDGNILIIPAQGEFGEWHPGCSRECRKPFLQCRLIKDIGRPFKLKGVRRLIRSLLINWRLG